MKLVYPYRGILLHWPSLAIIILLLLFYNFCHCSTTSLLSWRMFLPKQEGLSVIPPLFCLFVFCSLWGFFCFCILFYLVVGFFFKKQNLWVLSWSPQVAHLKWSFILLQPVFKMVSITFILVIETINLYWGELGIKPSTALNQCPVSVLKPAQ